MSWILIVKFFSSFLNSSITFVYRFLNLLEKLLSIIYKTLMILVICWLVYLMYLLYQSWFFNTILHIWGKTF